MEVLRSDATQPTPFVARSMRRLMPVLVVVALVLSGCSIGGGDDDSAPTATVPAVSGMTDGSAAPRFVSELADRISTAWLSVGSYRATTVEGNGDLALVPLPAAPVVAPPTADPNVTWQSVVDEVVLPGQRHYLENSGGVVSEFTAVGGRVYARGRFTQIAIRPDLEPTTWVNLDPTFISPDSTIGQFLSAFAGADAEAFHAPLADLQPDTRNQELTAVGPANIGGRQCDAYRWVDTSDSSGEPMTRTVSIDRTGLPCSLEFTGGDYSSRTTWDAYGQLPAIVAPAKWVTVGQTLDMGTASGTPETGIDAPPSTPAAVPVIAATPVGLATPERPGLGTAEPIATPPGP